MAFPSSQATAAALVIAVADHGQDEVAAVLDPLDLAELRDLAVTLAEHVDPDRPLTHAAASYGLPDPDRVITATCVLMDITREQLLSDNIAREFSRPRQIAMTALRLNGMTLQDIGAVFARQHCTVIGGIRNVRAHPELHRLALIVAGASGSD